MRLQVVLKLLYMCGSVRRRGVSRVGWVGKNLKDRHGLPTSYLQARPDVRLMQVTEQNRGNLAEELVAALIPPE